MAAEKQNLEQIQAAHAELYDSEAALFDDISLHEDTAGKLRQFLLERFSFDGKSVLEAGAGAGRITDYYADRAKRVVVTDAYESMVGILKRKYKDADKVTAVLCDHRQLRSRFPEPFDVFLSAFSFNYAFDPSVGDYDAFLSQILPPAGQHIIIECCGFYEEFDYLPPESIRYVRALENRFQKTVIPTEFVFSSPEQAVSAAKVLFSPIAERVREQNRAVIPELIHVYCDGSPGLLT